MFLKKKVWKPILCLDFDGVLHSYESGWKGARNIPDCPVPDALAFVLEALEEGFDVHVLSSRSHQWGGRRAMRRWLREHFEWEFNHSPKPMGPKNHLDLVISHEVGQRSEPWHIVSRDLAAETVRRIKFPKHKPPAHVTIDDRAIQFSGEWPDVRGLLRFKPWNRRNV